jgi:hypothetical protein
MEARVAAVAGAAAEAMTELQELVVSIEEHSRSGSPERIEGTSESTNPQAGEADPTMGAVVRGDGPRGRLGHPLASGGPAVAVRTRSKVGTEEEKLWFRRLDASGLAKISSFRREHKVFHGTATMEQIKAAWVRFQIWKAESMMLLGVHEDESGETPRSSASAAVSSPMEVPLWTPPKFSPAPEELAAGQGGIPRGGPLPDFPSFDAARGVVATTREHSGLGPDPCCFNWFHRRRSVEGLVLPPERGSFDHSG